MPALHFLADNALPLKIIQVGFNWRGS
jgi:hypothetical protein